MKVVASVFFFIILITLIFSCSHPEENTITPTTTPVSQETEQKLTIYLAGELNSRRTFANIQFIDDDEEMDRYVKQQEKSNPELMWPVNEILRKRFEELGIVKDNGLLLHSFSKKAKPAIQLDDESGKKINVLFIGDSTLILTNNNPRVIGPDSCEIKYPPLQDLRYAVLDVIPGGNKEIVLLNEWYIMNGYNFDLQVYEICMK